MRINYENGGEGKMRKMAEQIAKRRQT